MDASIPPRQPYNQQRVVDFFRVHVRLYGNDWRALGWHSRQTQFQRFAVLAEVGDLHQQRVLDVGCGLGDLYGYLGKRNIWVTYTGYDLVPEMVERASKRFPEARFVVKDVLQGLGDEPFDYILCSGAFNINFGDNLVAIQRLLREMYAACTRGVAINFLSISDPRTDPIFYLYDPQVLLTYCQTFCPHVRVRQDYLPNDCTLYLWREMPA